MVFVFNADGSIMLNPDLVIFDIDVHWTAMNACIVFPTNINQCVGRKNCKYYARDAQLLVVPKGVDNAPRFGRVQSEERYRLQTKALGSIIL